MSEIKVNSIKGVGASAAAITVNNTDGTCTANITNNLSNRNLVINGAMQVSQRGTSFTSSAHELTLDRMHHAISGGFNFDTTTTQDSSAPDGFSKSLKITPDSVVTPTGGLNGVLETKLEGQDVQSFAHGTSSAKAMTISFYAKSASQNNNAIYSFQVIKNDGSNSKYVLQPFTVTSNWQRFSFTFNGDTAASIVNTNALGLRLIWSLSTGPDDIVSATSSWTSGEYWRGVTGQSNFMDNTSNEFYLTGVQLEVGSVATDFEHRSFAVEKRLCMRYYQQELNPQRGGGRAGSSANKGELHPFFFPVEMRSAPTVSITNAGSPSGQYVYDDDSYANMSSLDSSSTNSISCHINYTLSADLTNGSHLILGGATSSSQTTYKFNAEL